ncbi:uncharacterized protein LOC142599497 [Balearica regulorum gibbericeps]|uniref:uncharacterized protein LOC142599497 n=1 Tax=Balearica regulorum gibbericeps TaxID=100784 RepID=UPI003F5D9D96
MPKGPGDDVLLDTSPSCPTAWWCRSNRLRLDSHKLSLPCLFRFLPALHDKAQEKLKQPKPPAQPRLQLPACAPQPSRTGTSSLRTERAEKRLRLLMASKRQEVEAEVWRQYHANRAGQNTGRGQSPCRHVFEDPYRPPHLLRKAYAEQLKERLQEKERCRSPAWPRASEGRAELCRPETAWASKGEKTRLLERREEGKAQGLPALPRSCQQPRRIHWKGP